MTDPTQFNETLRGLLKQPPKTHEEMIGEGLGNDVKKRRSDQQPRKNTE